MTIFLQHLLRTVVPAMLGWPCWIYFHDLQPAITESHRAYYFNAAGNDANDGSKSNPWQTIEKLNHTDLNPGDTVYFEGGQTFHGNMLLTQEDAGTPNNSIVITSCNNGKAVIDGDSATALTVYQTSFVEIRQLGFRGAGRKTGNTKDGVVINQCNNISIDSIAVSGFQHSGLLINTCTNVTARKVWATENGFSGIYAVGEWNKKNCSNILISYCTANNNPGDPSNLTNHSGNGILAGYCSNVRIDYCSAGNNGWDMPRKGNGPVGIWCFEADSVVIEHCISYKNKTARGAADGGGFDLDGGVTNSTVQYCLSYENEGSGYGIFQYAGAGRWSNNTIRYCISENDGSVSAAHAGVFVWNSSGDSTQLSNCFFYNNTVYNTTGAAISYEALSAHAGFHFYNNIFVAKKELITGKNTNSEYMGNNWYSLEGRFFMKGCSKFTGWATKSNQEKYHDQVIGFNTDPFFSNPGHAAITDPVFSNGFSNYRLPPLSVLSNAGLDLKALLGIDNGGKTFNGTKAGSKGMGAFD